MKVFRNIIVIILILAVCAAVYIYATHQQGGDGSTVSASGTVVINEFMASNGGCLPDEKGEYNDWVEIYNPTDQTVSLAGLGLTDENSTTPKWSFPRIDLKAGAYLVVFASGTGTSSADEAYQNAAFKLNATSGSIYLTDSTGKALDMISYDNQTQDVSMGRVPGSSDEWQMFAAPTPGFSNDEAGRAAFEQSRIAPETGLLITEVMASNKTTIADNNGAYNDYIEIYNGGSEAVNLAGYGLSDDAAKTLKWKFPEVTIKPGAYLVLYASGQSELSTDLAAGAVHTNFRISSYQEIIIFANPQGLILDQVAVSEIPSDNAYSRILSGGAYGSEWEISSLPTPGYSNDAAGYSQFEQMNQVALGDVVITEVMTSNASYLQEDDGGYYDWIELYNRSSQNVNLSGFGLTDDSGNPAKWRFGDISLAPGQYMTILASGLAEDDNVKKKYIHTNYKLSIDGEVLSLFDNSGKLLDRYNIRTIPRGASVGRTETQNSLVYFKEPTPGAANSSPSAGVVISPVTSTAPGSYDAAQQITLSCGTEGAVIYYTIDGTEPTQSCAQYTGAISIGATGMIRARSYKEGFIESAVTTATFFIGEQHSLPIISLVTAPDNLWNEQTGIYALGPGAAADYPYLGANFHNDWEKPASFEVFNESGTEVFTQDIAIRIQGGFSRGRNQKSFALLARSEYGPGAMEYPFFENRPYTQYQSLVLRNGGQDQSIGKIREAVALSLMEGQRFNVLTQAIKPYVVYLNGEYWGVYFLMEKRNEVFIAQHEGIDDPDHMNVLKASSIVLQGSNEEYKSLIQYVDSHDMSLQESYDYVATRVDTNSFMDMMICQLWVANSDYANLMFYQILPDGQWKQIYYDFCWTLGNSDGGYNHLTLQYRLDSSKAGSSLLAGLLRYKPWRDAFVERFAWALKEVYNPDRVIAAIDEIAGQVRNEMPAERAKFGGSMDGWEAEVQEMKDFASNRGAAIVGQLKSILSLSPEQSAMLEDAIEYH